MSFWLGCVTCVRRERIECIYCDVGVRLFWNTSRYPSTSRPRITPFELETRSSVHKKAHVVRSRETCFVRSRSERMNGKLTIRIKGEDDPILSDEELAWKLHAELNTGSPTLRTRSTRSREKSAVGVEEGGGTPVVLGSRSGSGSRKRLKAGGIEEDERGEGMEGDKDAREESRRDARGKKARRRELEGEKKDWDQVVMPRRSPRALEAVGSRDKMDVGGKDDGGPEGGQGRKRGGGRASSVLWQGIKEESREETGRDNDSEDNDNAKQPRPKKGRSRKGKPHVAADGAVQQDTKLANEKSRVRRSSKNGSKKPAPKIPKLPMVKEGEHWYRTRVLKETEKRIHVEFAGYEQTMPAMWLPKYSERVWLGSYKGKDWRYHGDGAWVPKNGIKNKVVTVHDYDVHEGAIGKGSDNKHEQNPGNVDDEGRPPSREELKSGRDPVGVGGMRAGAERGCGADGVEDIEDRDAETGIPYGGQGRDHDRDLPSKKRIPRAPDGRRMATTNNDDGPNANTDASGGRNNSRSRKRGTSSESGKRQSGEDSVGVVKRHRPKRATKKTALFSNADFSLEMDADSDGANGNNLIESEATNQSRGHQAFAMNMNVLDDEEQEALVALAEMPASPACRLSNLRTEAMLENSREALLEAYTNGKGDGFGGGYHHQQRSKFSFGGGPKRQWKRSFKSEPNLRQSSYTSESVMVAGRVFGGLMHAISARIGNGIHRTASLPPISGGQTAQSPRAWSPHVWTSGVSPADSEPAIVQVPTSLIQRALVSPRYKQRVTAQGNAPPVPLFH